MMRYMTMFITIFVTLLIMLKNDMKIKWIDESQGVSPKKFMSAQHRNPEDVKENKLKGLIIVDIELVTVKHHRAWVDEADKKSQCLETYHAKRKTMESEREAKDQIMVQINKYTCNGGRRYQEPSEISKIDPSTDPKVEAEMLIVKMHQTKAIRWNQAKSGDDAAEKFVSNDDKKLLAEATQLLENVLEQSSKVYL